MTRGGERLDTVVRVRSLCNADLEEVIRIDALHTGEPKRDYWRDVFHDFIDARSSRMRVGLAADGDAGMIGFLLGEIRAFEFGSGPCGWVFSVGVDPWYERRKVASMLLAECCSRFRGAGVDRVRTMVVRNNVPVLSFFRANGFVAGSFAQLELDLEEVV